MDSDAGRTYGRFSNAIRQLFRDTDPVDSPSEAALSGHHTDMDMVLHEIWMVADAAQPRDPSEGAPPATTAVIESLIETTITIDMITKDCAVCREGLLQGERAKALPCHHQFHSTCIVPWLEMRNTCPVCRYELPTDDEMYDIMRQEMRSFRLSPWINEASLNDDTEDDNDEEFDNDQFSTDVESPDEDPSSSDRDSNDVRVLDVCNMFNEQRHYDGYIPDDDYAVDETAAELTDDRAEADDSTCDEWLVERLQSQVSTMGDVNLRLQEQLTTTEEQLRTTAEQLAAEEQRASQLQALLDRALGLHDDIYSMDTDQLALLESRQLDVLERIRQARQDRPAMRRCSLCRLRSVQVMMLQPCGCIVCWRCTPVEQYCPHCERPIVTFDRRRR